MPSYKDPQKKYVYAYKRINHFRERANFKQKKQQLFPLKLLKILKVK